MSSETKRNFKYLESTNKNKKVSLKQSAYEKHIVEKLRTHNILMMLANSKETKNVLS